MRMISDIRKPLVACLLVLGACASTPSEAISVVAGFYPIAEAAERIGGERVEVTNLTPPGAEPHDLELTTTQLDAVIDADLIVYIGGGFQPALEAAVDRTEGESLDLADGADPHIWLNPSRWASAVERVGAALDAVDPGAQVRARAYAAEIRELDEAYRAGLADCERDLIVTAHASFGYLADAYGLRHEAITGLSPEAEPDPRHMADLIELVDDEDVTTVFTEPLASAAAAETLAREAGVEVATLDPIEGLTTERIAAGDDYLSVMADNLDALRDALGCR